jgi:predicted nucleic acid-binding protein
MANCTALEMGIACQKKYYHFKILMLIYLDTCCLNRPFDDQSQPRIQLETGAVLAILQQVASGELRIANSSVLQFDINRITDQTRQNGILHFLSYSSSFQPLTQSIEQRGVQLNALGFKRLDALHLAAAEFLKADVMLTTDDQLLRLAVSHSNNLTIPVINPVQFTTT